MINKKLLFLLFCISNFAFCQIQWQPSWRAALDQSVLTGKSIMVECYHPSCSHCITLNTNLENAEIVSTLNENFINYKINLADFDQIEILKKYNIRLPSWPMILFFDTTERLTNYFEPNENPDLLNQQFVAESEVSCLPCREKETLEMSELLKCALYSKILQDPNFNNEIANKIFEKLDAGQHDGINSWMVFKKFVLSTDNKYFDFWINNIVKADAFEKNPNIVRDVLASMLQAKTLYLIKQESISQESIEVLKNGLRKLGADDNKLTAWTWNLDLLYYLKQNDVEQATALCNKLTIMYKGQSTYLMLYKVISDNEAQKLMYLYFLKNKEYLEATLKNPDEQKQYYVLSASFYGKNKQILSCKESLSQAKNYGLSENEHKQLLQSNCN